jgi:hypothetical protein
MFSRCVLATVCLFVCTSILAAQSPTSTPASTPTELAVPAMEDPQVGDHWTYELRDDISGSLKSTFTTTITDVSATGISIRIATVGNANFSYVNYDRSWNRTDNDSWRFTPNDGGGIRSPLTVGKTWTTKANDLNNTAGLAWKRTVTSKVTAQESVTTKAGTFDTFKIETTFELQNSKDPTKKFQDAQQMWYAPAIDHWVRRSSVTRSDGRVRDKTNAELIEYGRR